MATISPAMAAPPWSAAPSFLEVLDAGCVPVPVELASGAAVVAAPAAAVAAAAAVLLPFTPPLPML